MKYIFVISSLSCIVPVILVLYKSRQVHAEFFAFRNLLFFACLGDYIGLVLWFFHKNNLPVFHLYVPIEYLLYGLYFRSLLKSGTAKQFINFSVLVIFLLAILEATVFADIWQYNTYSRTTEGGFIIVLCLFYFQSLLKSPISFSLTGNPNFIIAMGLLFYFSATLFVVLSVGLKALEPKDHSDLWIIHGVFLILLNFFFSWAMLKVQKPA